MAQKRVIVITGGARGIGAAAATLFAQRGDLVCVLDVKAPLPDLAKLREVQHIECDVSHFESVHLAIEKVKSQSGRIDCLYVNAGVHVTASLEETTLEQFEKVLGVNFKGAFYILKCVLPVMQSQKHGVIVLTGSDQSVIGKRHSFIYGATKGALGQITKSLALDNATFNIRVNCVCPGAIKTDLYEGAIQSYAKQYLGGDVKAVEKAVKQKHPLGRLGTPEEVAKLVYFLCSNDAEFMTGGLIPVDGGYTCQ